MCDCRSRISDLRQLFARRYLPLMETARDSGVGRVAGEARGGGVAGEARGRATPERSGLSNQHALALKGKPVGMNALGGQTLGFELIGISLIGNLLLGR